MVKLRYTWKLEFPPTEIASVRKLLLGRYTNIGDTTPLAYEACQYIEKVNKSMTIPSEQT